MTSVTVEAATPRAIAARAVLAASDAKDEINVPITLSVFRDKNGERRECFQYLSSLTARAVVFFLYFIGGYFLEVMQ